MVIEPGQMGEKMPDFMAAIWRGFYIKVARQYRKTDADQAMIARCDMRDQPSLMKKIPHLRIDEIGRAHV